MLSYDQRLDRYTALGRPLTGPQLKRLRQKDARAQVVGDKSSPVPWKLSKDDVDAALALGRSR